MTTTMTEIAKEAGVSLSLVSRLLRNDKSLRVAPATRARVLAVQKQLGQVQIKAARQPFCHVIVPINRNNVSREATLLSENLLCRQFEKTIKASGGQLSMALFDHDNRRSTFEEWMDQPQFCNGFLLLGGGIIDAEIAQLLIDRRFPHISVDSDARRYSVNTLHSDWYGAYLQVVSHLKALGHRRIAFVGLRQWRRYSFFGAALLAEHLPVDDALFCELGSHSYPLERAADPWRRHTRDIFARWFETAPELTAICCNNDWVALGVIDVLRDRGLTPGRDISVVGYDNLEVHDERYAASAGKPFLTTIDNHFVVSGRRAAERILDQVAGNVQAVHETIPAPLIVRETTGPASTS